VRRIWAWRGSLTRCRRREVATAGRRRGGSRSTASWDAAAMDAGQGRRAVLPLLVLPDVEGGRRCARGGERGRGSVATAARRWEGRHGHSALIAQGTRVREDWSSHERRRSLKCEPRTRGGHPNDAAREPPRGRSRGVSQGRGPGGRAGVGAAGIGCCGLLCSGRR
jgi:hypothetical protein